MSYKDTIKEKLRVKKRPFSYHTEDEVAEIVLSIVQEAEIDLLRAVLKDCSFKGTEAYLDKSAVQDILSSKSLKAIGGQDNE